MEYHKYNIHPLSYINCTESTNNSKLKKWPLDSTLSRMVLKAINRSSNSKFSNYSMITIMINKDSILKLSFMIIKMQTNKIFKWWWIRSWNANKRRSKNRYLCRLLVIYSKINSITARKLQTTERKDPSQVEQK